MKQTELIGKQRVSGITIVYMRDKILNFYNQLCKNIGKTLFFSAEQFTTRFNVDLETEIGVIEYEIKLSKIITKPEKGFMFSSFENLEDAKIIFGVESITIDLKFEFTTLRLIWEE